MERTERLSVAGMELVLESFLTRSRPNSLDRALSSVPFAFDDSAGNQQQSRTFFQADGGSVGGGMGKESEGQAGRGEFGDSGVSRSRPGVCPALV